ncbi:MAG: TRAP transporter substrate-binding protein [Elusimicrobiota bacterium]|jgi:tripartite ATP-independent transporter DctP family solute receptor|nr:TRAP transporter substrate-binding protein [Elusimicrobiota bacterium]
MKKLLLGVMTFMLAFAVISCGGSGSGSKTTVWKLAFNQSIEHPQAQGLLWLSDQFFKETNGAYRIEVNPNELLGNQKEAFESLQNGVIQMAVLGNPIVEAVNPDFAVLALPGLYRSIEFQQEVYTNGTLNELFATTTKNNFYTLAAVHAGVRNVYAKKPVRSPADLKGMKIRVQQSQLMIDVINAMGAIAVPMSQGEVYTAIQQGVLDGAENNEVTFYDLKQYEVAPVYSYTKHFMIPDILVINKETYESLSPEHKAIFDRLVKETIERIFANFIDRVTNAKEEAISKGATFIDDFDSSIFNKNFVDVISKTVNTPSKKKLYDSIANVK